MVTQLNVNNEPKIFHLEQIFISNVYLVRTAVREKTILILSSITAVSTKYTLLSLVRSLLN